MLCCLNPRCPKPINPDGAAICRGCRRRLISELRGRYRPLHLIGQGGFGRTYLAEDCDRLKALCVIKQLSPQVTGTESTRKATALFTREAVRLDELGEHPQIPALLAYFEQDGYLYLVQQYIEGVSLAQELQRNGPFNEANVRRVLLDLLPVLQFVHARQVIHRDITPTNILRRRRDHRLVLIDFGVAKQLRLESGQQPGTQIGTEGYAPVEQLRGGQAYPASDLYSLGATCIHLLTATKPEQLFDPLKGEWLWPARLAEQNRPIHPQLAALLHKLLQDVVRDRYQSAAAVWQDLRKIPRLRPAAAGAIPPPPPRRPPPPQREQDPEVPSSPPLRPVSGPISEGKPPPSAGPPLTPSGADIDKTDNGTCELQGHTSWVTATALHPRETILASGGLDDVIWLWDLRTGDVIQKLTGHVKGVNALAFSPDGRWLISGSDDFSIKVWDPQQGQLVETLTGHIRGVAALAVSPDSQLLVSGSKDRTIRVWSLLARKLLKVPFGVGSMIRAIAVSPDGSIFVSGGLDRRIKLWSFQTAELLQTWAAHEGAVTAVAVSPNSQVIASAGKDGVIKLWDRRSGQMRRSLVGHSGDVNAVVFSPDGACLISGGSDRQIHVWNLVSGQLINTLEGHTDSVNALSLSQKGDRLISGSADKTVRSWRLSLA